MVNTYGVPGYGEANPALLATVSFPFLFGVMYGDVGHGSMMLLAGILLCTFADQLKGELELFVKIRYMLLLMGFFATYMGFIYNDFMSMPLNFLGKSCYSMNSEKSSFVQQDPECSYGFGFDPVWMQSKVDIQFYNSFKMKISVIYGVAQMSIGIIIKGMNANYFGRDLDFYHEFIPQFILLLSLFGFMDFLIIEKWLTDWRGNDLESKAPSIINVMIELFLNFGNITDPEKEAPVIAGQETVCKLILALVLICPPWMLLVKPLIMKQNHELESKLKEISGGDYELSQVSSPEKNQLDGIELTPVQAKSEESAYEVQEQTIEELSGPNSDEEYLMKVLR